MQEVVERLNQKYKIELSLRIGIHICTGSQQGLNFWGAGFEISRLLADGCLEGDIVLSLELVKAQGPDAVWPDLQPNRINGIPAFIVRSL